LFELIAALIHRRKPPSQQKFKMHEISFEDAVDFIQQKDPRYSRDAYFFVREALDHTQELITKEGGGAEFAMLAAKSCSTGYGTLRCANSGRWHL